MCWAHYPVQFEEEQSLPTQFLFVAKRATRERSASLRYIALSCLFRLLETFATERNPYAAILYKKLTFSLIENYEDLEVRDFMECSFAMLFAKFSSIPIDVLVEPLVKQSHVSEGKASEGKASEGKLNLCDMQLLQRCCTHPKMTLRLSLTLLDLMARVYLNDFVFAHLAFA